MIVSRSRIGSIRFLARPARRAASTVRIRDLRVYSILGWVNKDLNIDRSK
jgi:hypothetical protein